MEIFDSAPKSEKDPSEDPSPEKEKEEPEKKEEEDGADAEGAGDADDDGMDFDLNNLGGGGMTDEEKAALDEKLDKMQAQIEDILAKALFKEETKSAKAEEAGEDE